jgi:hypothetical protein
LVICDRTNAMPIDPDHPIGRREAGVLGWPGASLLEFDDCTSGHSRGCGCDWDKQPRIKLRSDCRTVGPTEEKLSGAHLCCLRRNHSETSGTETKEKGRIRNFSPLEHFRIHCRIYCFKVLRTPFCGFGLCGILPGSRE